MGTAKRRAGWFGTLLACTETEAPCRSPSRAGWAARITSCTESSVEQSPELILRQAEDRQRQSKLLTCCSVTVCYLWPPGWPPWLGTVGSVAQLASPCQSSLSVQTLPGHLRCARADTCVLRTAQIKTIRFATAVKEQSNGNNCQTGWYSPELK